MGDNSQNVCSFCGYSNNIFANCRKSEREHSDSQQDIPINEQIENRVCNAFIAVMPVMLLRFVENALGRKKKNHLGILLLRVLLLLTNRVPIRPQTHFGVTTVFSQQNVHLYRNNQLEIVGVRKINNLYLVEFVAVPYISFITALNIKKKN